MSKPYVPGQTPDLADLALWLGTELAEPAAAAPPPAQHPPGPGNDPPPAPPTGHRPVTTNPGLADGADNVINDPALGFRGVVSYSLDGTGNNLAHVTVGATGTDEARIAPANFAAGTTDTPVDGPSARLISDVIMAGDPNLPDPGGRSAFMYAFGQFVDHDIDLNLSQTPNASNTLSIVVPAGDPFFTPGTTIDITRGQVDPANGKAVNAITSFLDLSQVYGSDAATAASLRNADGTLITSAGGNLPVVQGMFQGGDVRAAENPDLTSLDVLFVREHNYRVGQLHAEDPSLTGDQLYDMARSITTAEYQNIVYKEYLPALLGPDALTRYKGYDPNVTAQIFEEFSTAAYRFGHAIVSPTETKIANDGTVLATADLIAAAFEPTSEFGANGGADALLRNLAQDFSQQEGVHITSDLLNLLDAGGDKGDLGAIDIERERDLGIATLNQTREALGLHAYTSFDQITSDPALAAKLQQLYGSVDKVDLFVGGLAENAAAGAMVGATFQAIIALQFDNLRDGDRLFYLNQHFTPSMMDQIENTTLSELIVRDTDTSVMQADAFTATIRHASDVASSNPSAPQLVIGIDADNAVIKGEAGVVDTLVAGAGANQTLVGKGSSDSFVFLGSGHHDSLVGFQPGTDKIVLEQQTTELYFRDVTITAAQGSALVQVGGNTLLLVGVSASSLSAHDFLFSPDNPALAA
jgi:peroxidase